MHAKILVAFLLLLVVGAVVAQDRQVQESQAASNAVGADPNPLKGIQEWQRKVQEARDQREKERTVAAGDRRKEDEADFQFMVTLDRLYTELITSLVSDYKSEHSPTNKMNICMNAMSLGVLRAGMPVGGISKFFGSDFQREVVEGTSRIGTVSFYSPSLKNDEAIRNSPADRFGARWYLAIDGTDSSVTQLSLRVWPE